MDDSIRTKTSAVFDQLVGITGAQPDRRGECHIDCPFCGKEAKRGQTHFSFSARGYHCFVCGASGSLERLFCQVTGQRMQPRRAQPAPRRRVTRDAPARNWARIVAGYQAHPRRYELWRSYKPLSEATIHAARLGVGVFPKYISRCRHERLMVPLVRGGKIVGLRGRGLGCGCPKWLTAAGSETILYGLDEARNGGVLWVVENIIDALLIHSRHPDWDAVASSSGVATWRDEWTEGIAQLKPRLVIVAFDNDLPGQALGKTRAQLADAWRAKTGRQKLPPMYGRRVANALLREGVSARLFQWPAEAPPKADIGWLFEEAA